MVSPADFYGHVMHKNIVNEFLADPELLDEALKGTPLDPHRHSTVVEELGTGSGVKLSMDEFDDLIDLDYEPTPCHPSQAHYPSYAGANAEGSSYTKCGFSTSPSRGAENGRLSSAVDPLNAVNDSMKNVTIESSGVWSGGKSSKDLFSGAKKRQSAPPEFSELQPIEMEDDVLDAEDLQLKRDNQLNIPSDKPKLKAEPVGLHAGNLLYHQYWNPASREFNPDMFYSTMVERYRCPVPHCL